MERKSFFNAICNDDFIKDGVTNLDTLVEELFKIGFFVKKDIKNKKEIKELNSLWNGDGDVRESQLFSSMIRKNNCFFVSDEYMNEVIGLIFDRAKNEAITHLFSYKKRLKRNEEGYINKDQLLEFYSSELIRINNIGIELEREYEFLDINLDTEFFPERIKMILREKLHSDGKFNQLYVTYYKADDRKPYFSIKHPFNNIIMLFCINEKLNFLKERIGKIQEAVEDNKKEMLRIKFKEKYLKLFNSEEAFNIFIGFVETYGKDNITSAIAVKLKELLESAYPKYNLSRMSKKISKRVFSEILNEILNSNLSDLRGVQPSTNPNIEQIFKESIKLYKSKV